MLNLLHSINHSTVSFSIEQQNVLPEQCIALSAPYCLLSP
jgi:hypothetical protein